MGIVTKETLKSYFNKGDKPTETQFEDLIDSFSHTSFQEFTNITASSNISASNRIFAESSLITSLTASSIRDVNTTNVTASEGIIATEGITVGGTISGSALSLNTTVGASSDLDSDPIYFINGSKVEIKAITAANIADGAFAQFTLHNTSIASDSIVLGSFTGNTVGLITGSILTAATISTSTASIQIHNETGAQINADTPFTASFVVIG